MRCSRSHQRAGGDGAFPAHFSLGPLSRALLAVVHLIPDDGLLRVALYDSRRPNPICPFAALCSNNKRRPGVLAERRGFIHRLPRRRREISSGRRVAPDWHRPAARIKSRGRE